MNRKKLLIVTPGYLPLLGGMEEQCYLLAQEALRRGIGVDVITERTSSNLSKFENMDGVRVFRLAGPRSSWLFYFSYAVELTKFLYKKQHDYSFSIIRTFTFPSLVIGLLKITRLVKLPTIVSADTGGEGDELLVIRRSWLCPLFIQLLRGHNKYNALCASNLEHMNTLGFEPKKITRIYNGLDATTYQQSIFPSSIKTFLFLGQLRKEKGLGELLEAFKRLVDEGRTVRLRIAGDGPYMKQLQSLVETAGLESRIDVLGRISRMERDDFLESGDCLILPSYSEGFSLVVGEAMLKKRYVICSDVADFKRFYGDSIYFCNKKDTKDLYRVMRRLIDSPPKQDITAYNNIASRLSIHFTFDEFMEKFPHQSPDL